MRSWLPLLAASVLALLNGCGSSSNNGGNGTIRFVNATTATYDFYNGTQALSTSIGPGAAGAYASLPTGVYPFYLYPAGTTTTPTNGSSRSITGGLATTLVAYATSGTIATAQLNDNQTAPASGYGLFRVFNTSNEGGAVDVYVTAASVTDLSTVSPITSNTVSSRLSPYVSVPAGSYRVRITGTGNYKDVRLDLTTVPVADQEVATLVLTTAAGGTLLNAVNIDQLGGTTSYNNPYARVRLVGNVSGSGSVAATVNNVALAQTSTGTATSLASPGIGDYTLVPAGALTTSISVNGSTVTAPSALTAAAGTDATLFVGGSATSPTITLTSEDNAEPVSTTTSTTTQSKLRVFNGLNGLSTPMSLTVDFTPIASNVAYGTSSASALFTVSSANTLQATSTGLASPAYSASVALAVSHVYTVFVLGDSTAPQSVLRRDR